MQFIRCILVGTIALTFSAASLEAEEFFWKAPVDGNFDNQNNWLPFGTPGALDTAIFDLGSSGYTVANFDPVGQIQVNNDTVTFESNAISTAALKLGNNSGDVADLTYQFGRFLARSVEVGVHAGAEATFRTERADVFTNFANEPPGQIVIGAAGKGTWISDSGSHGTDGSIILGRDATAVGTFTGEGGQFGAGQDLIIGQAGKGTATFTDNASVSFVRKFVVGQDAGSAGEARFQSGSRFEDLSRDEPSEVTIGDAGKGKFIAEEATDIRMTGTVVIGNQAGSEGEFRVGGDRASLLIRGNAQSPGVPSLVVGNAGKGSFEVSGSAQAEVYGALTVGKEATGDGTVTVRQRTPTGHPAFSVSSSSGEAVIGDAGKGALHVLDRSTVEIDRTLTIGRQAGSHGEVLVDSSSRLTALGFEIGTLGTGNLNIRGNSLVDVWGGPIRNHSGGTIEVDDATLIGAIYSPEVAISNAGAVINNGRIVGNLENLPGGTLSGNGTYEGLVTQSGGTLSPGNSPGTLLLDELAFNSGTIEFEITQTAGEAGDYNGWDLISVAGEAVFDGPMTIDLVSLILPYRPGPLLDFDSSSNYSWMFLTAGEGISGFDPSLITIDTSRFDNPFTGQFFVTQDGDTLLLNYAVPEPGSCVLLGLGVVALVAVRRRRASS